MVVRFLVPPPQMIGEEDCFFLHQSSGEKIVSEMTCEASNGTLNSTIPYDAAPW